MVGAAITSFKPGVSTCHWWTTGQLNTARKLHNTVKSDKAKDYTRLRPCLNFRTTVICERLISVMFHAWLLSCLYKNPYLNGHIRQFGFNLLSIHWPLRSSDNPTWGPPVFWTYGCHIFISWLCEHMINSSLNLIQILNMHDFHLIGHRLSISTISVWTHTMCPLFCQVLSGLG